MSGTFYIQVLSDVDYEDLLAEIYCGEDAENDFVAIVSQESGFDSLDVVIYPRTDGAPWSFKYDDFISALSKAKSELARMHKDEAGGSTQ